MNTLLILAALGGFFAFRKKKQLIAPTNNPSSKTVSVNTTCDRFYSPVQLTKSGFGYDNRVLGLSGLFLFQYNWKAEYEDEIVEFYEQIVIKHKEMDGKLPHVKMPELNELILELSKSTLSYLYADVCKYKEEPFDNALTLSEYLILDSQLLILFILYKKSKITQSELAHVLNDILNFYNKYTFSDKKLTLINTSDDKIIKYYKTIFNLLPDFKTIPANYLAVNEIFRSSIYYSSESNQYKFYKFNDIDKSRLIMLIGKAANG